MKDGEGERQGRERGEKGEKVMNEREKRKREIESTSGVENRKKMDTRQVE